MKAETVEEKAKVNEAQEREQRARQAAADKSEKPKPESTDSAAARPSQVRE
jgi:hypothetical protein